MKRLPRPKRITGGVALSAALVLATLAASVVIARRWGSKPAAAPSLPDSIRHIEPGWDLRIVLETEESVNSLVAAPDRYPALGGNVFVGTAPRGDVYKFHPILPGVATPVALGLGDFMRFGTCCVNRLAIRDLDGDGIPELVASTSQVEPRGRPRLYVWSFTKPIPILRGMARPDIRSSWGHGLGFVGSPDGGAESVFATFCGHGEVVEYRLMPSQSPSGFRSESVAWKVVGQLPASGEWVQTADVDNDGRADVCLATGYAERGAAILIYTTPAPGATLQLEHRIDEAGRFGNVRFLVEDVRGDGSRDLVAWWCTDYLYGGDCEVVRYRLGSGGVRERTTIARGTAGSLWPDDGQMVAEDLDRDGRREVWFASKGGYLWRYEPGPLPAVARVLHLEGGFGPIAVGSVPNSPRPSMFLGWGRRVLRLERSGDREGRGGVSPRGPTPSGAEASSRINES